jgi:Protein of unknown function (DUF3619)
VPLPAYRKYFTPKASLYKVNAMTSSNMPKAPFSAAQIEAFENRFAQRLLVHLDASAAALPHDISERLRVAREQAVSAWGQARAAQTRLQPQLAPSAVAWSSGQVVLAGAGAGGFAGGTSHTHRQTPSNRTGWGWRFACALPVLTLLAGLWGIHQWQQREQVQVATDIDMALLTDELPPSAYADPGFEEFLSTDEAPSSDLNNDASAIHLTRTL